MIEDKTREDILYTKKRNAMLIKISNDSVEQASSMNVSLYSLYTTIHKNEQKQKISQNKIFQVK